ncbi:MAG TPA: hypothetical protein VJ124_03930 [Pyrinomonadaceae bacterium]|nr:hypothetical protein [Pyrinomonadaceae bacterium]
MIKLLSYNIRFGGRGREPAISNVISRLAPELVVFQEAIDPEVIRRLAESTGLPNWAARPQHSVAFLSRVEISHHEWHYPTGAKHSFLEIVLAGSEFRIFGLHLSARFSKWSEQRRTHEIRALLKSIERHQHGFHVLVAISTPSLQEKYSMWGRMPAWIRALIWLSGRDIQRQTIQVVKDADYVDGCRSLHPEEKGYTFPVWRLDYVFLPKHSLEHLLSCEVVNHTPQSKTASDHFPLLARIAL